MKDLVYICAQPVDKYFIWMVHLWLESLKQLDKSDKAIILIFVPDGREKEMKLWDKVIELYPEAEFKFYGDSDNLHRLIAVYIPIIRPYVLMKYFQEHPELKEKAIFYCDCDILFTSKFDVSSFVDDNTCYLSDTKSYISAEYFDSKGKVYETDDPEGTYKIGDPIFALKDRFEDYKKIDVLNNACELVGINREIAVKNIDSSGGAQYLLKNIDYKFWKKVLNDCMSIYAYLGRVNKQYFPNESKGFQRWAGDMFSVLWNLWYKNYETKIIPEMEFAWSTDSITRLDKPNVGILHNAGITGKTLGDIPTFYKGYYHKGNSPFKDPYLYEIHNNEKSKTLVNWYYVNEMIKLHQKYKIEY